MREITYACLSEITLKSNFLLMNLASVEYVYRLQNHPPQPIDIFGTIFLSAGPTFSSRVNARKYSTTSSIVEKLAPNKSPAQASLIAAAYVTPTWKKHDAAINSFTTFDSKNKSDWPLTTEILAEYVPWALQERKLKSSTVEL